MAREKTWNDIYGILCNTIILSVLAFWMVKGAVWAADDTLPMVVNNYTAEAIPRGGAGRITISITRNLSRECSVRASRSFIDSEGVRHPIMSDETQNAKVLAQNYNERRPMIVPLRLPYETAPGWGTLVVPVAYFCNPWHSWFPINAVNRYRIEVLP